MTDALLINFLCTNHHEIQVGARLHQRDLVGLRAYRRDVCGGLLSWSPFLPSVLCVFFSSLECRPRYSDVMAQSSQIVVLKASLVSLYSFGTLRRFSTFRHLAKKQKHYLLAGQGLKQVSSVRLSSTSHLAADFGSRLEELLLHFWRVKATREGLGTSEEDYN